MTPEEKGRFCGSCSKTVLDFTKATDKEIIQTLNQTENSCGRFYNHQLNRDLLDSKPKKSFWILASISLIGFLGLNSTAALAQTPVKTEQTEKINTAQDTTKTTLVLKRITGVVSDEFGSLPGALIVIKGTNIGTTTDIDGNFEIEAKEGDILEITFTGFEKNSILIGEKNNYAILMREVVLGGIVIGVIQRRSFFGRQIQKIRNLFR
jgi:hypothetical protein